MALKKTTAKRATRDAQLTIRIPSHLRELLDRVAESERRSVADVVIITLEDRFARSIVAGAK